MNTKEIIISLMLIALVATSVVSYFALESSRQSLTEDFSTEAEETLLRKTIVQAKQLDSILGETASVVEASAAFAERVFSDPTIPDVTSYYHNPDSNNLPPDLVFNTDYGREISTTYSAYKIAPKTFDDQNTYLNLDPETWNPLDHVNSTVRDTILKSAKLDLIWRELYATFPNHVWLYMGFELGFHRSFPWHSYSKSYDPRIRPWYVGAVTGAKDMVVILDTSGSMQGSPMENTKEAAKQVFGTLGPRDSLSVASFSGNVRVYNENLEIFSNILQSEVNSYVDNLVADGTTNINEAINRGLDILRNTGSEDKTPVIIFMTDGEPTAGELNKNNILDNIQSNNDINAKIFVFGLGSGIDSNFLSNIADQNNGDAVFIQDSTEIADAMSRYYEFFTNEVESNLMWSYPYIDQSGFGFIITASKPVIVDGTFYGVISADLTLTNLIDLTKEFKPSTSGYNFIFDSAGVMVVHPEILDKEPQDWTTQDIRIPIENFETFDPTFLQLKSEAISGNSVAGSVSYESGKNFVAFSPIGNTSLRFASIMPQSDVAQGNYPKILSIEVWQISWIIFSGLGLGLAVLVIVRGRSVFEEVE